jgi:putative dimethyl sulfoxide reductase chaperone
MEYQGLAELARAEGAMLGLLAKGLFRPTLELAEELRSGAFIGDLRGIVSTEEPAMASALGTLDAFAEHLKGIEPDEARLALEVDYNRLFVGPSALLAPPYESFYETTEHGDSERGSLRGRSERAVNAEYLAHGLAMPEGFIEFPDHIAVELEYLSHLASQEADAWERGDESAAVSLQEDQDRFRAQHISRWIEPFSANVSDGAKTTFYPAVTSLVHEMVR